MSIKSTATVEVNAFEACQLHLFYKDLYKRQTECYERFDEDLSYKIAGIVDDDLVDAQYKRFAERLDSYKSRYEKWLKIYEDLL